MEAQTVSDFKILQWNVVSLNNLRLNELIDWIAFNPVDVIYLQGNNLHSLRRIHIPGFNIYRKDRSTGRKGGDVAIFIRHFISYSFIASKEYPHGIHAVTIFLHLEALFLD